MAEPTENTPGSMSSPDAISTGAGSSERGVEASPASAGAPTPAKPTRRPLRALLTGLIVAGIIVGALVALGILFRPKDNGWGSGIHYMAASGILGEPDDSIDVIFLGNSEAHDAFSPYTMWGEAGFTSYTCGITELRTCKAYTFLREVTQSQHPRIVVIEPEMCYWKMDLSRVVMTELQAVLPALDYHDRWKEVTAADLTLEVNYTWVDELKGYERRFEVVPSPSSDYLGSPDDPAEPMLRLNRLYLIRIIDYCRSIGAIPVIVSTPSARNWNYARHNAIQQVADEMDVDYLDLNMHNDEVGIDWSLNTDDAGDHLNLAGAIKASGYVARYLAEAYDLPDHRADAAYTGWAEGYEWYLTQTVIPDYMLPQTED